MHRGQCTSNLLARVACLQIASFRGLLLFDQFLCVRHFGGLQLFGEDFALSTGLLVTLGGRQCKPHVRLDFVGGYALAAPSRVSSPGYAEQGQILGRPKAATTVRLPYRSSTHLCPPSNCQREHFEQTYLLGWPQVGTIGLPRSRLSEHLGRDRTPELTQTAFHHFPARPACAAVELERPVRLPAGLLESACLAPRGEAVNFHTRSSTRASYRRQ